MQETAQARHVFVMFLQQYGEQSLRRDQTAKPAVVVDHREAGFIAVHRLPGGVLLVGVGLSRSAVPDP